MKLTLRKKRLDNDLNALKDLNEDLKELTRQIRSLKEGQQKRVQLLANRQAIARRSDLSGYQIVRKTSENLYRALAKTSRCLAHHEHSAALRIDVGPLQESKPSRVRFNMAYSANLGNPVWINVESTMKGNSVEGTVQVVQNTFEDAVTCLKRRLEVSDVYATVSTKPSKPAESLRNCTPKPFTRSFEKKPNKIWLPSENVPGTGSCNRDEYGVPDLSVRKSCFHLQLVNYHATMNTDLCAGFIREGYYDHLLYLPPQPCGPEETTQSLAHIISSMSDDWPLSSYSRVERIRLAKILAKAVLEYHDTPWLRESWRSEDVQFFVESCKPLAALDAPHLSVRFSSSSKSLTSGQSHPFAENSTLFGLATILLELDFEKPLSRMRQPSDVVESSLQDTEFKTAVRLAKSTAPGLGPDFRKIIRKCLRCNFGIDETDLTKSEDLKSKIHEDVICKLEDLERTLTSCTLGDSRT